MKHLFLSLMVALCGLSFVAVDAQAKRLGGGGTSGMQRQMPAKPTPMTPPPQQAAPTGAVGGAAAAVGKRSWLGPIAGLAAGLGLAALMSHLGLGEEFANMIMLALLAVVAFVAVRWLIGKKSERFAVVTISLTEHAVSWRKYPSGKAAKAALADIERKPTAKTGSFTSNAGAGASTM